MKKTVIISLLFFILMAGLVFSVETAKKPDKYIATLTDVKGDVEVKRGDDDFWGSVKMYTPLEEIDSVRTGEDSHAEITFDEGSIIVLKENTELKIMSVRKQMKLRLKRGRLLSSIFKSTQEQFVERQIYTPTSVAAVRGTEFAIDVENEEKTDIGVFEGQVSVKNCVSPESEEVSDEEILIDKDFETTIELNKPLQKPVALKEKMLAYKGVMKSLNKRFERVRKDLNKYRDLRLKQYEKFKDRKDKEIQKYRGKSGRSKELDKYRKKPGFGK